MLGQGDLGSLPAEIYTGRQAAWCALPVFHHMLDGFETTNCSCIPPQKTVQWGTFHHEPPQKDLNLYGKFHHVIVTEREEIAPKKTREKPSACTHVDMDSHLLSFGFIFLCTHASTWKHRSLDLSYPLEKKKYTKYVPFCH